MLAILHSLAQILQRLITQQPQASYHNLLLTPEEAPATEEKERLVKNIAKQWEERLGQKARKEKTQDQRRPKPRGIGAAKRNRPLTQFALETLRDAEP
jgi:hypothetical protein